MPSLARDSKQVLFARNADTVIVARTPSEGGLSVEDFYLAIKHVRDEAKHPEKLTVIFENEESDASWTIGEVSYDKDWLRLA